MTPQKGKTEQTQWQTKSVQICFLFVCLSVFYFIDIVFIFKARKKYVSYKKTVKIRNRKRIEKIYNGIKIVDINQTIQWKT